MLFLFALNLIKFVVSKRVYTRNSGPHLLPMRCSKIEFGSSSIIMWATMRPLKARFIGVMPKITRSRTFLRLKTNVNKIDTVFRLYKREVKAKCFNVLFLQFSYHNRYTCTVNIRFARFLCFTDKWNKMNDANINKFQKWWLGMSLIDI